MILHASISILFCLKLLPQDNDIEKSVSKYYLFDSLTLQNKSNSPRKKYTNTFSKMLFLNSWFLLFMKLKFVFVCNPQRRLASLEVILFSFLHLNNRLVLFILHKNTKIFRTRITYTLTLYLCKREPEETFLLIILTTILTKTLKKFLFKVNYTIFLFPPFSFWFSFVMVEAKHTKFWLFSKLQFKYQYNNRQPIF